MKKKASSNSNSNDWRSGKGEDSEKDSEDEGKQGVDSADKLSSETLQSLLDAYLLQVRAFGESSDAAVATDDTSVFTSQPEGGTKRTKPQSGQEHEHEDGGLVEDAANGITKQPKLPKLPKVSHVEQCQSQALDHSSRMSGGFEALAVSQKPDTPEQFNAKVTSGVNAISSAISTTIAGAIHAWAEMKKNDRACVRPAGHEFAPIEGTAPPIIVCKHCALRI
jgi:hypothetical protein